MSLLLWVEKHLSSSQSRFLVAGVWNTAFGYLTFAALYLVFSQSLHYLIIAVVAQAVAVSQAFVFHRRFVFQSAGDWKAEFLRYNLSVTGIFLFGLVGLSVCVEQLGFNPLLAQAVVTGVSVVISYLVHREYSFRKPGAEK
jgi:putative flippase GtrA